MFLSLQHLSDSDFLSGRKENHMHLGYPASSQQFYKILSTYQDTRRKIPGHYSSRQAHTPSSFLLLQSFATEALELALRLLLLSQLAFLSVFLLQSLLASQYVSAIFLQPW